MYSDIYFCIFLVNGIFTMAGYIERLKIYILTYITVWCLIKKKNKGLPIDSIGFCKISEKMSSKLIKPFRHYFWTEIEGDSDISIFFNFREIIK